MAVPYTFATATSSIPLSQLDSNFATTITLGNTAIQLGNTVTTLNNMTLANVSISSGNVTFGNVTATTANVTTANVTNLVTTTDPVITSGTANAITYLNASKALTSGSGLTYDGSALVLTSSNISYAQFSSLSANGSRIEVKDGGSLVGYIGNGANSIGSASATQFCVNGTSNIIFGITGNAKATLSATSLSLDSTVSMTLNSGTANGVAYLNGSKVLTTGSELTTNGSTYLTVPPEVYRTSATSYMRLSGGDGAGSGANVIAFGQSHATAPGRLSLSSVGTGDIISNTISGTHIYQINNSEQMRLTSTGLGIGTSSPGEKLSVSGALLVTGGANSFNYDGLVIDRTSTTSRIASGSTSGGSELAFWTAASGGNETERMRLDSSGNLGLGVTPSAWSGSFKALQVSNTIIANNGAADSFFGSNYFFDGTNNKYIASAHAATYGQVDGAHIWYTAPSGTAGNAITFTQAMTLDASGNLGLGNTNPASYGGFVAQLASGIALHSNSVSGVAGLNLYENGTGRFSLRTLNGSAGLSFFDTFNGVERARITSGGYFKASNAGTYINSTGNYHELRTNAADYIGYFSNTNASSPFGIEITYTGTDPNGTGNRYFGCYASATQRLEVRSNGGLANYQANDVNLSDRREKINFAPAKSYLDTICAIPVQTFNYIDQSEDDPGLTLGVVAQDVQAVAPELVMESNWGTEENPKMRLSIYQTDLQYALMKCIQEQQVMINELKAKVAALEAK